MQHEHRVFGKFVELNVADESQRWVMDDLERLTQGRRTRERKVDFNQSVTWSVMEAAGRSSGRKLRDAGGSQVPGDKSMVAPDTLHVRPRNGTGDK